MYSRVSPPKRHLAAGPALLKSSLALYLEPSHSAGASSGVIIEGCALGIRPQWRWSCLPTASPVDETEASDAAPFLPNLRHLRRRVRLNFAQRVHRNIFDGAIGRVLDDGHALWSTFCKAGGLASVLRYEPHGRLQSCPAVIANASRSSQV